VRLARDELVLVAPNVHRDGRVSYGIFAVAIGVAFFVAILAVMEIGRRIGLRRKAQDPEGGLAGTGAVDGAVFTLLGLLVAFTFSGAADRFDTRRHLVVEETNAIGTAYLRIDLLPPSAQPAMRDLFRRYVDARIETYRRLPDIERVTAEIERSKVLQREIWTDAVAAGAMPDARPPASLLLLPALNAMIDISTTRMLAVQMHPPAIIYALLFVLALAGALLAGHAMAAAKRRSALHVIGFAAATAIAVYVIIDLELPRLGFIRVEAFDRALVELRESMR
jgi:hypothetical protein